MLHSLLLVYFVFFLDFLFMPVLVDSSAFLITGSGSQQIFLYFDLFALTSQLYFWSSFFSSLIFIFISAFIL